MSVVLFRHNLSQPTQAQLMRREFPETLCSEQGVVLSCRPSESKVRWTSACSGWQSCVSQVSSRREAPAPVWRANTTSIPEYIVYLETAFTCTSLREEGCTATTKKTPLNVPEHAHSLTGTRVWNSLNLQATKYKPLVPCFCLYMCWGLLDMYTSVYFEAHSIIIIL